MSGKTAATTTIINTIIIKILAQLLKLHQRGWKRLLKSGSPRLENVNRLSASFNWEQSQNYEATTVRATC